MSASRNLGLDRARGEFVAVLDGDDCWLPGKLTEQVALLDAHPRVGLVSGGFIEWRSWQGGRDETWLSGPVTEGVTAPPRTTLGTYPIGRANNPTAPMVRRALALEVGGYEEVFAGLYEDQAFLAKVYLAAPVYWSRRIWLKYRRHDESEMRRLRWADYTATRAQFLDWLENHVASREVPGRRAIERAIAARRRELRHRYIALGWRRLRRLGTGCAAMLGFSDFARRYRHGGG